jgi:hypothetical protein
MEDVVSDLDPVSSTLLSSFREEEDSMRTFFGIFKWQKTFLEGFIEIGNSSRSGNIRWQSLMTPSNSAFMHLCNVG